MADPADLAGVEIEREEARRADARAYDAAARVMMGRSECACGESISAERKDLGAFRCMDCQEAYELKQNNKWMA